MRVADISPGAPPSIVGRNYALSVYEHLSIGNGQLVVDLDDAELRRRLAKVMHVDHALGRSALLEQYASLYYARYDEVGRAAIAKWFAGNGG